MQPPSIGEAVSKGLAAFKANLLPVIIGILCAAVLGLIPIVGGFLALAGIFNVALKAIRGQKPEPKDGFVAFEAPVDHIVVGLLQICGLIACCIGVFVTQPLFLNGTFLVNDKKLKWGQAKDECMAKVKPHLLPWLIFWFVLSIISGAGMIAAAIIQVMLGLILEPGTAACLLSTVILLAGFAVSLFLAPVTACAYAYAYDKTLAAK